MINIILKTQSNEFVLFLQDWFDQTKTDDNICIDDYLLIYTEGKIKQIVFGYAV